MRHLLTPALLVFLSSNRQNKNNRKCQTGLSHAFVRRESQSNFTNSELILRETGCLCEEGSYILSHFEVFLASCFVFVLWRPVELDRVG